MFMLAWQPADDGSGSDPGGPRWIGTSTHRWKAMAKNIQVTPDSVGTGALLWQLLMLTDHPMDCG